IVLKADIIALSSPLYLTLILIYLSLILVSFLEVQPSKGKVTSVISYSLGRSSELISSFSISFGILFNIICGTLFHLDSFF
ncbi:MAG: hypothetical protein ACM67R_00420, partial [Clostridiales bacterium]